MTKRQSIKLTLLVKARKYEPKTREEFNRMAGEVLSDRDDHDAELERIDTLRAGSITRLYGEVWNEYLRDKALDESLERWAASAERWRALRGATR